MSSFQADINHLRQDFNAILQAEGIKPDDKNREQKVKALLSNLYICTENGQLKLEKASFGNWLKRIFWSGNYTIATGSDTFNRLKAIHDNLPSATKSTGSLDKSVTPISNDDLSFATGALNEILRNIETRKESGFFKTEEQKTTIKSLFESIINPPQTKAAAEPQKPIPAGSPKVQVTVTSSKPISQTHEIPKEAIDTEKAKSRLSEAFKQLGDKAIGTYTISSIDKNEHQLHVLQAGGKIISHDFSTTPDGKPVYNDASYERLDQLFSALEREEIINSLKDKAPGTFCIVPFEDTKNIYIVCKDNTVKPYRFETRTENKEEYTVTIPGMTRMTTSKATVSTPLEMMQKFDPKITKAEKASSLNYDKQAILDSMKGEKPGTFFTISIGKKEEFYIVLADGTPKQFEAERNDDGSFTLEGTIYKSVAYAADAMIDKTLGKNEKPETLLAKKLPFADKILLDSLLHKPPGTYLAVNYFKQNAIYFSDSTTIYPKVAHYEYNTSQLPTQYIIDSKPYSSPEEFAQTVGTPKKIAPPSTPKAFPIEAIDRQIQTIQYLNQKYFVDIPEEPLKATFQPFMDKGNIFLVRSRPQKDPVNPSELSTDFEIVAGLGKKTILHNVDPKKAASLSLALLDFAENPDALKQNFAKAIQPARANFLENFGNRLDPSLLNELKEIDRQQSIEFMWKEQITVLPGGQIRHKDGRIFNPPESLSAEKWDPSDSIAPLVAAWGLDKTLYDAYASSKEEIKAFNESSTNSFIVAKEGNTFIVSARQGSGPIKKNTVEKTKEGAFLFDNKKVDGELMTFLEKTLGVPLYNTVAALENFLENKGDVHDSNRVTDVADMLQNNDHCFSLSQNKDNTFTLTTHVLRKGWNLGVTTTGHSVTSFEQNITIHPNGTVDIPPRLGESSNIKTIEDLQAHLSTMKSVKQVEIDRKVGIENRKTIETFFKTTLNDTTRCSSSPSEAEKQVNGYWEVLGEKVVNKCMISRSPSKDELVITYKNNEGNLVKETLQVTHEKVIGKDFSLDLKEASPENILAKINEKRAPGTILEPLTNLEDPKIEREDFLKETVAKRPDHITGILRSPKTVLESSFNDNLAVLASRNPKDYAIYQELDGKGIKQVYLSYVNDKHDIVSCPIPEGKDIDTVISETKELGKNPRIFNHTKKDIEKLQTAFTKQCDEIAKRFVNLSQDEVNSKFNELTEFFGTTAPSCWCIRTEEKAGFLDINPFKKSPDRFIISVAPKSHYTVQIYPSDPSPKFFLTSDPNTKYDSLEEIRKKLNTTESYETALENKEKCEHQEEALNQSSYIEDYALSTVDNKGNYKAVVPYTDEHGKSQKWEISFSTRITPGSLIATFDGKEISGESFEDLISQQLGALTKRTNDLKTHMKAEAQAQVNALIEKEDKLREETKKLIEPQIAFIPFEKLTQVNPRGTQFNNSYALTYNPTLKSYRFIEYPPEAGGKNQTWNISRNENGSIKITRGKEEKTYPSIDDMLKTRDCRESVTKRLDHISSAAEQQKRPTLDKYGAQGQRWVAAFYWHKNMHGGDDMKPAEAKDLLNQILGNPASTSQAVKALSKKTATELNISSTKSLPRDVFQDVITTEENYPLMKDLKGFLTQLEKWSSAK